MKDDVVFQKKTFQLDTARAVPAGIIETVGSTFAVLIAIRVFDAHWVAKSTLQALPSVGLLLSLFVVQYVRRTEISVNRMSALIWVVSGTGFLTASLSEENFGLYVAGMIPALIGVTLTVPLLSQIYRKHYPGEKRGQLFAMTGMARKLVAISAALGFGWLLDKSLTHFPWLMGAYAASCFLMAVCVLMMAPVTLQKANQVKLFEAFRHVGEDEAFRKLLASWMVLGIGNLLCFSIFVEYIGNPDYGYDLSERQVGLITTVIPEALFFIFVLQWGRFFDRLNFYVLRIGINFFFAVGILFYFLGHGVWALYVGIGLHGIARAGGNVAWSLWVTKFADEEHVAEYMSVHTFLTGLRGSVAPFIAFPAAIYFGPQAVGLLGASLIFVSTLMIIPLWRKDRRS